MDHQMAKYLPGELGLFRAISHLLVIARPDF